jgi:enoyl reductase-like protein
MSGTTTEPTVPTDGVIESVDASTTVEAGTFTCVVRKEVERSGDEEDWWIRVWIDRATGVMVRSEIHDQAGAIRGDAELIELN